MNDKLYWFTLVSLFVVGFVIGQFGPQPEVTAQGSQELRLDAS